jgi:hypothetical protein
MAKEEILFFKSEDCVNCPKALERVSRLFHGSVEEDFSIKIVDVGQKENLEFVRKFSIRSVPGVVFGGEFHSLANPLSYARLDKYING